MTNASVIHCLGVDTEETVIESAQYAAPELAIPIEPPKRGMLLPTRGKRLQHPRTIRFATGVSIMISRQSAATIEAKRIQLAMEMIISQDYTITFGHATYASFLQSGASSFTVKQEDTKGSFGAEASFEILAVKLLSEEITSNQTWDVWVRHAIKYSQGRVYYERTEYTLNSSAKSMAYYGAAFWVGSAGSLSGTKKLHPRVAWIIMHIYYGEYIMSHPGLASRNNVGAKRNE